MAKSLFEDLHEEIPKVLEKFIEQRFKGIIKALEPVRRIESEQLDIRKDLENLQISYKHLESEMEKIRVHGQTLPKTLGEKVENAVESAVTSAVGDAVPEAVNNTFDVVNKKVRVEKKEKKFWKFW